MDLIELIFNFFHLITDIINIVITYRNNKKK